ncbi:MAG: hypothetical protein WBQ25_09155 [Nitrososphaeraceae archaeon]
MNNFERALHKRMSNIVKMDSRPFSYMDFVPCFEVDGKVFEIAKGTFKNIVSEMVKRGELEVVCYSPQGFYTLKGVTVAKPLNVDHIGVHLSDQLKYIKNDPFYRSVMNLPFGQKSLHNIRLRFEAGGIWSTLLTSKSNLSVQSKSKDISLPVVSINNLRIRIRVHRTDIVSIIIGCSNSPVAVDVAGVTRLSNALARIREILEKTLLQDGETSENTVRIVIPNHRNWLVTMWHFGADALADYSGNENHRRWGKAEVILITIYTKEWENSKRRIRWDCQEYPKKSLIDALQEKMGADTSLSQVI